jgi:hypothetical protein
MLAPGLLAEDQIADEDAEEDSAKHVRVHLSLGPVYDWPGFDVWISQ